MSATCPKQTVCILAAPSSKIRIESNATVWESFLKLAAECVDRGEFFKAHQLWNRSIIYAKSSGISQAKIGLVLKETAEKHYNDGQMFRALPYAQKAVECLSTDVDSNNLALGYAQNILACICFTQGHWKESEAAALTALRIMEWHFGPRDEHVATICHNLAIVYQIQHNFLKAEAFYCKALQICGHDKKMTADIFRNYQSLLNVKGRTDEAEKLVDTAK